MENSLNPIERLAQHRNELERLQLQAEKSKGFFGGNSTFNRNNGNRGPSTFSQRNPSNNNAAEALNGDWGSDKQETGSITTIDYSQRRGTVKSEGTGEVMFYLEQCKYGMRKIKTGDRVRFRLDTYKPRPVAVEVSPVEASGRITEDDVNFFIIEGRAAAPIYRMRSILLSREEWPMFLSAIPPALMADVVLVVIRLATYQEQLSNPIHLRVIRSFLQLLAWAGGGGDAQWASNSNNGVSSPTDATSPSAVTSPTGSQPNAAGVAAAANAIMARRAPPQPIFPNHIQKFVAMPNAETITLKELEHRVNVWIDVAELVLLYRRLTTVNVDSVSEPLLAAAEFTLNTLVPKLNAPSSILKALRQIIRRASPKEAAFMRAAIIPSVEEMMSPTWVETSPFYSKSLPVITEDSFDTSDAYVVAHCKLLRADNFSKTINVLGQLCFDIPAFKDITINRQRVTDVSQDAQHHRLFDRLKFLGRNLSRANDYAVSRSFVFGLEAADRGENGKPIRWMSCLDEGSLVCFTTGLDRSKIDANEIFWGVVSCNDDGVRAHKMVAVHPIQGDFDKLLANIERNKAQGQETKTQLLETSVFFTGYRSIMEGLLTFIGPHSAHIPFKEILLAATKNDITSDKAEGADDVEELDLYTKPKKILKNPNRVKDKDQWHVPQFAVPAFRQLVHNSRATFTFDCGQDESMRKLDRRPILLVQGPPGTGKSFMGCRIVETYVRYKQMLASGEILNSVDVEKLQDPLLSTIAPSLEANKSNYLGPIVVITYKNHALDEFLLDMRRSKLWEHDRARNSTANNGISYPRGCRIVRIGGRSAEAELDQFNLNSLMMGSQVAKNRVAPFRERIYLLSNRMERLAKEIAHLEKGNVPSTYFNTWLTDEQRKTINFSQKDAWLRGDHYTAASHGQMSGGLVPPTHYLSYLKSDFRARVESGAKIPTEAVAAAQTAAANAAVGVVADEEGQRGSVFGDMEKELRRAAADEDGSGRSNRLDGEAYVAERFSNTCVSAESIRFGTSPPKPPASVPNPSQIMTLWSLAPIARHQYYAYLIQRSIAEKAKEYLTIQEQVETTVQLRAHAQDEARLELLQQADVIGLTTTGCAMNQALLRALKPRVLVVEEAAEVLESQLIACMSESLSQLVLIGDHYQLKPSVETYELETHNKFNTSLFERLTRLIDPILLVEQRRMRPGISGLVRQFYDRQGLQDHSSVLSRPFVDANGHRHYEGALGLQRDAFLWSHTHPEETADSGLSKVNTLEVKLCHILATHLTQQGVAPSSITVITPYLGQKRALSAAFLRSQSSAVRHVRVSTVDLFQGDENDIIIVSLVRTAKLTAFMKLRNRMIVACSRARHAMVLIGSEDLLAQSEHWNEVLMTLRADNSVGEMLPITQNGEKRLLCHDGTTLNQ